MRRAPLPTHEHEHCATLRTMSTSDSTTPAHQAPPPATDERAPDPAAVLDLDQAATYAGRKPTTLRRALRADKLPRRYRPGLYGPELVFTPADLDAWLSDMARAVESMPTGVTPASSPPPQDATATDDAATDSEPSTALVELDTLSTPIRLYALVALAYAQRLHNVEEAQQHATIEAQQQAAALDARLAQLEARLQQGQQQAATTGDVMAAPVDELTPAIPAPEATKGQRGRSRWEKARAALIRALS